MFPRYLQYLLTDFRQTFVTRASRDRDELIKFLGQKVKVQGHTIAAEAHSTRRYRRVQLFLVVLLCCLMKRSDDVILTSFKHAVYEAKTNAYGVQSSKKLHQNKSGTFFPGHGVYVSTCEVMACIGLYITVHCVK